MKDTAWWQMAEFRETNTQAHLDCCQQENKISSRHNVLGQKLLGKLSKDFESFHFQKSLKLLYALRIGLIMSLFMQ